MMDENKEIPVGRAKDLRGQRFGKLTVLYRVKSPYNSKDAYWLCQCDCGNKKRVNSKDLQSGATKTCNACPKYENLLGQKFGRLTVIEDTYTKASNGSEIWKCQCDCGKILNVRAYNLKNGNTQSCGCYQKERTSEESKVTILPGTRYGLLTVIKEVDRSVNDPYMRRFLCQCDCGNKIIASRASLGHTRWSCGCLTSLGQTMITKLLNENNISFEIEKTFNNFKYSDTNGIPRFDFFINNQYLLEYDGNIHFNHDKDNSWNTKEEYEKRHKHDLEKNQWCQKNNIPLIRIPYTHLNNLCIEDLLLETTQFRII